MSLNTIVIDDFYENPVDVRNFALTLEYEKNGIIPGFRSKYSLITNDLITKLDKIMSPFHGKITNIEPDNSNGTFVYTTMNDMGWVHVDLEYRKWVGIVYLTPNAPVECGTSLYCHKKTKNCFTNKTNLIKREDAGVDPHQWDIVDNIGNVFNRLFIYPSHFYHNASDFFGSSLQDGRLVQTFFFELVFFQVN